MKNKPAAPNTKKPGIPRTKAIEARERLMKVMRELDSLSRLVEPQASSGVEMVGSIGVECWDPQDEITKRIDAMSRECGQVRGALWSRMKAKTGEVI